MNEDINNSTAQTGAQIPLYEHPGRLDPNRNVPITRRDRVDVNVHYDDDAKRFLKDSDSPEFTEQSANAMNPFEDRALLKGDVKPKSTGVKTGAAKFESKIFVPETDTEDEKSKVKESFKETEQPVYISDEDKAATSDYIADAMSGVETAAPGASILPNENLARLKMYAFLLGVVVVLEIAGIALLVII